MKMDLTYGYKEVLVGNQKSANEYRYFERLLDRISNGKLPEDRRNAITELQAVVSKNQPFQLAFGAMGLPVMLSVLKEEPDDIEMIRGALETLVSALTPINHAKGSSDEVQPALMNIYLLSREADCISLLLSLLEEDDFYVRYYTLQILTVLLTDSPQKLKEAILTIPRGITQLLDMLMDREVIRNEALLLLTDLTRVAEEIQKIVFFEGAFEKIFSIIREEGNTDGGVVVQDCLELLNNLLRSNASNQVLLRETVGLDSLILILKLRGSTFNFNQQKTINLLSALETIKLLLKGGSDSDPGKDMNKQTNKTTLVQKKILDHLLILGVESQWIPVVVRCAALQCIGDLIAGDSKNCDLLASKVLGEEPQVEPALNSILRILLRTSSLQEFLAADYIFKSFCEKNVDGQTMLASTLIPQPYCINHTFLADDVNMSFGSMLLHSLTLGENGDLEICCRAASVLSHILKDHLQCKERVLRIEIEAAPLQSLGAPEPLMHRIVKYLAVASSMKFQDGKSSASGNSYVQAIILKLLITWLADCPSAVHCFLDTRLHLTYLIELVSNLSETVCVRGFAAVVLGECVIYNKSTDGGKDAFAIVDAVSQKIGLSSYFLKFDEMQRSIIFVGAGSSLNNKSFTRSSAASMIDIKDVDESDLSEKKNLDHPILSTILDSHFVNHVKSLEVDIREEIVEVYGRPNMEVAVLPAELDQMNGESDGEYIKRLEAFVDKQCSEIQDLVLRNATLAEYLAKIGSTLEREQRVSGSSDRIQIETQEASQRLEMHKAKKAKVESEVIQYRNLSGMMEADLRSLSDAYNNLEQSNLQLENEVKTPKREGHSEFPDVETIKTLLFSLVQEKSKVDRLTTRLLELGEDVNKLLEGVRWSC